MGSERVIGVSGDIRRHPGTRLSGHSLRGKVVSGLGGGGDGHSHR